MAVCGPTVEASNRREKTPSSSDCGGESDWLRLDVGLRRSGRLISPVLFEEAFATGEQFPSRTLVMWIRHGSGASRRLGVVASKRTFRRAVDRNRARRLLREAFRLNRHRLRPDVDVVLLARRRILEAKRPVVEQNLVACFRDAGVLHEGEAPCPVS